MINFLELNNMIKFKQMKKPVMIFKTTISSPFSKMCSQKVCKSPYFQGTPLVENESVTTFSLFAYSLKNKKIRERKGGVIKLLRELSKNKGSMIVSSLRDFIVSLFCLIRRLKPPVNKVLSLRDISPLTQHHFKLLILHS